MVFGFRPESRSASSGFPRQADPRLPTCAELYSLGSDGTYPFSLQGPLTADRRLWVAPYNPPGSPGWAPFTLPRVGAGGSGQKSMKRGDAKDKGIRALCVRGTSQQGKNW